MKKSIKMIVVAIILLLIFAIVFVLASRMNKNKISNSGNEIVIEDINEVSTNYISIDKLPEDYSIQNAIDDGCYVAGDRTYNEDVLERFLSNIENKKPANIRIAYTLPNGNISLIDIVYDSNKMKVIEDRTRDTAFDEKPTIEVNEYNMKSDYIFTQLDNKLEDGTIITEYILKDMRRGDDFVSNVLLFGTINTSLRTEDFNPIAFRGIVSRVEENRIIVNPDEGTDEHMIAKEISILLDEDGTLNGMTFEEGNILLVKYRGEITELDGVYQISDVDSIDKF